MFDLSFADAMDVIIILGFISSASSILTLSVLRKILTKYKPLLDQMNKDMNKVK